jgi:hypothetical protein
MPRSVVEDAPPTENGTEPQDKVSEVAAAAPRFVTFDQLVAKPRRKLTFPIHTIDADGDEIVLQMTYQSLTNREYDELVERHPPEAREKAKGAQFNVMTFSPALVSAVSFEPRISFEQAKMIFESDTWSGGELATLFINAQRVCNSGLDVPFTVRD